MTEEKIILLREYAEALLPPSEIAVLLEIPADQRKTFVYNCKHTPGSVEYETFQIGRLTTKLSLRKTVVKLAIAGSPAAEPLADKFITEQLIEK